MIGAAGDDGEVILHPEERPAGPWTRADVADVLAVLREDVPGPFPVLAVDGRSASGKSTVARRIRDAVRGAAVVHTDDIAWYESFFGWERLLRDGVLGPVRRGELPVAYRPPAWDARGREGAVHVPASCSLLVVEGVGAGRRGLADLVDGLIWVQSDRHEARRRGLARDGEDAADFWDEWDAEEVPFLAAERPWDRAGLVVAGTRPGSAPDGELLVARPPPAPSTAPGGSRGDGRR